MLSAILVRENIYCSSEPWDGGGKTKLKCFKELTPSLPSQACDSVNNDKQDGHLWFPAYFFILLPCAHLFFPALQTPKWQQKPSEEESSCVYVPVSHRALAPPMWIHTYSNTQAHKHIYTYIYIMYVYTQRDKGTHMHVYTHRHTHTKIYINMCAWSHTYIIN